MRISPIMPAGIRTSFEYDGHLLIALSSAKQTMEVIKLSLAEIDRLIEETHDN